ncbi:hypothetical protein BO86DRAFT_232588 [Aspergillus japonicus CBS 114.51]|uniref:Uncharacterized protein n=1 Tax=Aspergillus japonicus CBS 114.51 TaxID=1448312 RepID=A0A8T8WN43_ASPJA|nr:hypothetical protein BO86DRAFT_232588 [Aspergillus japonicus CBS 114.51]RAH77113.1 hypothetical protein BO86DRAFT_232588 [Aspergillus japonicus CBS 114.51]
MNESVYSMYRVLRRVSELIMMLTSGAPFLSRLLFYASSSFVLVACNVLYFIPAGKKS